MASSARNIRTPLVLQNHESKSVSKLVEETIASACAREESGTHMVEGRVVRALVHALFRLSDSTNGTRAGKPRPPVSAYFPEGIAVGAMVFCPSAVPSELLMRQCHETLALGVRPVVVTPSDLVPAAKALAKVEHVTALVDIMDLGQLTATHIYLQCGFAEHMRKLALQRLVDAYNKIIDEVETDPGLHIQLR